MLALAFVAALAAQEPWDQAPLESDPQALLTAAQAVKAEDGAAFSFLLRESRWTLEADGRAHLQTRSVYRILTEEGAQNAATVSAAWAPWYQERPRVRARVVTPDGRAHPLQPDTLSEQPVAHANPEVFTDRRMLTGPLPAVRSGAVVEVEILIRGAKPFFDRGFAEHHAFGASIRIQRERLVVDAPDGLPLRHLRRLLPSLEPRSTSEGGRTRLVWEAGPLEPRKRFELFAPGDVPAAPQVAFSTGRSWGEIAAGYHEIVEAQIARADLAGLGALPGADVPREERIARILALLQAKVRYTSLALGEASIVPRPPAETLKRGYGDCKDKSAILVAALRSAGIPANVALLLTGPGPDVEPELPGFGVFDHAIVHVPGAPEIWIDPTDKYARAGELPIQDQGRRALVAAADVDDLRLTPLSPPGENLQLKERVFRLADHGPASVVELLRPRGSAERYLRAQMDQDRKRVSEALTAYAREVFAAKKAPEFSHGNPADLKEPFEVKLSMDEAGRGQTDLREAVVAVPLTGLWSDLPGILQQGEDPGEKDEDPARPWREHDLLLYPPFSSEWRYRIYPPAGFEARPLPPSARTELGPAVFSQELAKEADGSVTAVFRFDTGKSRYTPAEARALRRGLLKLQEEPMVLIGFVQRGQAHLEAGRIKEALAEFRTLAADRPAKALHRAQIARALLAGGLGDAARREARKAVETEPGSLIARQTLGWVLQHDLIGRRFEQGWDPAEAEAAYREALKLEPDNLETTLDLAILLEHDEGGRRYAAVARLEEAIKLYRAAASRIAGTAFENNLSIALLRAGRFKELEEQSKGMRTQAGAIYQLTAKAVLEGADAALRHAARSIAGDEIRRNCLAQAGELLMQRRQYPQAGELLASAARGAAQAANLLGRADRIRKTRRWDALPEADGTPAGAIRRVLFVTLAPKLDLQALRPLLSRYLVEAGGEDGWAKTFQDGHAALLQTANDALPLEATRDIALSLLEPTVEGDDALGYRVIVPPLGGGRSPSVWFLRREDGELRLVGAVEPQLGKVALDLLAAGEAQKARRWLDWAVERGADFGGPRGVDADPFELVWKKGSEAGEAEIRRAAAVLASRGGRIPEALEILEKEAKDVEGRLRFALDHARAAALVARKRHAEAADVARALLEAEPESLAAYFLRCEALRRQRKWDELVAVSEERLKRKPDDPLALHSLQHHEMQRGRSEASIAYGRRLIAGGQGDDGVYNNLAWTELLEGRASEETLKLSQQSVMLSQGSRDHSLHTLATVYADLGRPAEARDVLLQTFQTRMDPTPLSHDWYVLGRIAEEYGALEAAADAYRKTGIDEDADLPSHTNRMALRRLKGLEKN